MMHDTTLRNFASESSFRVYVDYLALKKHFGTEDYDYHRYNGKVRASFDKFAVRRDLFFFYKLSKQEDAHGVLLANIVSNPNCWIRDIIEERGLELYRDWIRRKESLTYTFKNELKKLDPDLKENFIVRSGQHPKLMRLFMSKEISLETFTILVAITNSYPYWEKEIVDKIIARDIMVKSRKYFPFLNIDTKKFSQIVKDRTVDE
jgi:hypothetical protein